MVTKSSFGWIYGILDGVLNDLYGHRVIDAARLGGMQRKQ
jgi:hypothetical protein